MLNKILVDRFNEKYIPEPNSGCWLWEGARGPNGYGRIKIPLSRKNISAHRLSYLVFKGEIPEGQEVCHRCDNASCVNPDHLFAASHAENMDDKFRKGRDNVSGERNWSRRHPERVRRGEAVPSAKLSDESVRRIRELLADGLTQRSIALKYGVSQTTVGLVGRRAIWAHVA